MSERNPLDLKMAAAEVISVWDKITAGIQNTPRLGEIAPSTLNERTKEQVRSFDALLEMAKCETPFTAEDLARFHLAWGGHPSGDLSSTLQQVLYLGKRWMAEAHANRQSRATR